MSGTWDVDRAATTLLDAEGGRLALGPLSEEWPDLDLVTAYAVQDETLRRRLRRGERITGVKLGLTSKAKQERMGVDQPLVAWLTDAMVLPTVVPTMHFIHPRAEPEICFIMAERLTGPGVTTEEARAAVGTVLGGIELIDSRFRDFRFTLPDVVADNASSAGYVLGNVHVEPELLDVVAERCALTVDGEVVATATGAAVLGDPAQALALAANVLAGRGLAIEPGWLVMTGGLTDAVPLRPGSRIEASFAHLGAVAVEGS